MRATLTIRELQPNPLLYVLTNTTSIISPYPSAYLPNPPLFLPPQPAGPASTAPLRPTSFETVPTLEINPPSPPPPSHLHLSDPLPLLPAHSSVIMKQPRIRLGDSGASNSSLQESCARLNFEMQLGWTIRTSRIVKDGGGVMSTRGTPVNGLVEEGG